DLPASNPSSISGTTDASGQFQVTFSSATAGQVIGNATTTVIVGGQTFIRDTDPTTTTIGSGPGGSGPATKIFVDTSIQITPPTPVNVVGNAETFTITVTAFPAGTGTPAFGTPTVTYSPTPDLQAPTTATLVSVVGNVATYTLTINS